MPACPRCDRKLSAEYTYCPFDGAELGGRVSQTPAAPNVPSAIGRFEVIKLLGKGTMGRVFLARDPERDQQVAVKILDVAQARTPEGAERFLREAKNMHTLNHPNVMHVFEVGLRPDGCPFVVMEYLEGETLGALLRRLGALPIDAAARIAIEAAKGLNAAHSAGVIHRDVKPDNIFLVGPINQPMTAKVLDFGLARVTGAQRLTAKGIIVGTVEYMAPEQTVGDPTGMRTDVYALGVVLYRMLTGKLPFLGETSAILAQQLRRKAVPPSKVNELVTPALDRVTETAMRKLPRNRYSSMQDFMEDLERAIGDREGELTNEELFDDVYEPQSEFSKHFAKILTEKAATI